MNQNNPYHRVFAKPGPQPAKTPTLECGYGFSQVRVWVALEYPRVTRDNP